MTAQDKKQLTSFSPKDEKEAEKELDRLRKSLRKNGVLKTTHKWTGLQGKTLWDWLQLLAVLAIPLILGVATLLFGIQQTHLADLQHQSDQQSTLDQQRQATLVTYQDDMKDLLLNRGLLTSKSTDEVRVIARIETLSAMRQLDGNRNRFLVQFLQDAHLIGVNSGNIIRFAGAELNFIDLNRADLKGAILNDTYLYKADLSEADLSEADLRGAILSGADLSGADLTSVDLNGAILISTDLTNTRLHDAYLTQKQLDDVLTCRGAILPSGLKCHNDQ